MGRIGRLMAGILGIALAIASLREASPGWDTATSALAWSLVALATLCAVRGTPQRRAGRLAFALSGTALLLLVMMPVVRARMPLEQALDWLHPRLCRVREHVASLPRDRFDEAFSAWSAAHPDAEGTTLGIDTEKGSFEAMVVRWRTPTRAAFQHNGHAIAALVVAEFIGKAVSWLSGRR